MIYIIGYLFFISIIANIIHAIYYDLYGHEIELE